MRTASEMRQGDRGLAPDAIELLQRYDWPGNVRELQHAVERAVILRRTLILQPSAFDGQRFGLSARGAARPRRDAAAPFGLARARRQRRGRHSPRRLVLTSLDVGEAETRLIERALEVSGGNRTRAAELLGISVRTLRNKLNGPARDSAAG